MEESGAQSGWSKCGNCGHTPSEESLYCPRCGQKFEKSRIRFYSVLRIFFYTLFNADSSLWRTLKHMWIPGKLTREYFSGKRKTYFHPARLFFFSWVLFFAVFTLIDDVQTGSQEDTSFAERVERQMEDRRLMLNLMNLRDSLGAEDPVYYLGADTLIFFTADFLGSAIKTDNMDSLRSHVENARDSINIFTTDKGRPLMVAMEDLVNLSAEEIFERYEIEGFFVKLILRQIIKFIKETSSMVEYIIRGISWVVLMVIPVMAFIFYLLYRSGGFYYVEHLVFLLHLHAVFFVSVLLVRGLEVLINGLIGVFSAGSVGLDWMIFLVVFVFLMYIFVGLRRYYRSSIGGVIFKSILLFLAYILTSFLALMLGLILRFFLF